MRSVKLLVTELYAKGTWHSDIEIDHRNIEKELKDIGRGHRKCLWNEHLWCVGATWCLTQAILGSFKTFSILLLASIKF